MKILALLALCLAVTLQAQFDFGTPSKMTKAPTTELPAQAFLIS